LHHAKRALRASIDADARGDPASRAVDEIEHKPRPRDARLNS
jgi:hypothetical protein